MDGLYWWTILPMLKCYDMHDREGDRLRIRYAHM